MYPDVVKQFRYNSDLNHAVLAVGHYTDAGIAQFEVKLHENAHPVLIFGVLMQVAQRRKVDLFEELQEIFDLHNVFRCMHDVPLLE